MYQELPHNIGFHVKCVNCFSSFTYHIKEMLHNFWPIRVFIECCFVKLKTAKVVLQGVRTMMSLLRAGASESPKLWGAMGSDMGSMSPQSATSRVSHTPVHWRLSCLLLLTPLQLHARYSTNFDRSIYSNTFYQGI